MKKFLVLLGVLLIIQSVFLIANSAKDTVWTRLSHSVVRMEFAPNSNLFLSLGDHGGLRDGVIIFNTDGDTVKTIYNSEGLQFRDGQGISDVHFSKDGRFLVVIWEYDKDNMAKVMLEIFETENWTSVKKIEVPGDSFSLLAAKVLMSPDNKIIVAKTMEGLYFYDVQSGELLKHIWNFGQDLTKNIMVSSAVYSSDGSHIYFTSTDMKPSTTGDEKLRFFNTQTYEVEYTSDAIASYLAISKSGNMITKVPNLNELQIINPITKEIILNISVQTGLINSMVFSPDEKYLAVNFGMGKVIHIYDIQTGKSIYQYTTVPSGYSLTGLSISFDQKYIVSSSSYIFLYKFLPTTVVEKTPLQKENIIYPNPTNGIFSIDFHIDISSITKIQLYDLTGRIVKNIENNFLKAGNHNLEIDISNLPIGQYNLTIETITGTKSHKILVSR